ncbi:MAG: hypothetical protein J6Y26_02190, partial [Lachnospiraceae bacterium]|nr:hypothetical protein [Lachnospiraceae bacterium]
HHLAERPERLILGKMPSGLRLHQRFNNHLFAPVSQLLTHYNLIAFSRREAERQSAQRFFFNFWSLLSLMQAAPKSLDVEIIFPPFLSALSASLREIYTGCY